MPEHRRVLRQGHGDVHDHGRHLHAPLPVLRRGPRPAAAARRGRAREPRDDDRRAEARLRRRHQRRPRRPARRRRAALRRLHPRGARAFARHADRGAGAGLPRPDGTRARHPGGGAAGRDEPQPRDGAAPVQAGAPRLGLRALARAAARVQGARAGRADQVGPDGGAGRDRRRDPRDDARHARPPDRHADDRAVPAAFRRPPAGARYVHPDTFAMFEREAYAMGFRHAAVGALVRSSYHADKQAEGVLEAGGRRRLCAEPPDRPRPAPVPGRVARAFSDGPAGPRRPPRPPIR